MVEDSLAADVARDPGPDELELAQKNLSYARDVLDAQAARLRDTLGVIEMRGGASWPRTADDAQVHMCRGAAEVLRRDYAWLLERAVALSGKCGTEIGNLATKGMLAESRKAIELSRRVARLTRLAFVFVPLSFTSSLFGMNLYPLGEERYSLWLWVAVSLPILLLSLLFMKWDVLAMVKRLLRIRTKGGKGDSG